MKFSRFILLALLCGVASAADIEVHHGLKQTAVTIAEHQRLTDLYSKLTLSDDIDWSAAFLTNPEQQTALRSEAELLQNKLISLGSAAEQQDEKELADSFRLLASTLKSLPVASRIKTVLDPDWVRLRSEYNRPLAGSYVLYLPDYSEHVDVIGLAGNQPLKVKDGSNVRDYLAALTYQAGADRDHIYLIAPDGFWQKVPVAVWNYVEKEAAAGSIIYVGIDPTLLPSDMADLNDRIATYIANRIPE